MNYLWVVIGVLVICFGMGYYNARKQKELREKLKFKVVFNNESGRNEPKD